MPLWYGEMVQINNVKNNVFIRAPGIIFPVFLYAIVEIEAFNKNSGIASGRKEPK